MSDSLQDRSTVLDVDSSGANVIGDDNEVNLQVVWSNPNEKQRENLFSAGDHFSLATIEKNRNGFFPSQLSNDLSLGKVTRRSIC
jgi:hypothetical protein